MRLYNNIFPKFVLPFSLIKSNAASRRLYTTARLACKLLRSPQATAYSGMSEIEKALGFK